MGRSGWVQVGEWPAGSGRVGAGVAGRVGQGSAGHEPEKSYFTGLKFGIINRLKKN